MSRCTGAQRRDERLIRRGGERRGENCHLRTAGGDVVICFSPGKAGGSSGKLPPELPSNLISACVYKTPDWFRRAAARGLGDAVSSSVDDPGRVRGGDAMQRRGCRLIFHQTPPTAAIAPCRPSLLAGPPSARVGGGRTCCLTPCEHRYEPTVSVLLNCK